MNQFLHPTTFGGEARTGKGMSAFILSHITCLLPRQADYIHITNFKSSQIQIQVQLQIQERACRPSSCLILLACFPDRQTEDCLCKQCYIVLFLERRKNKVKGKGLKTLKEKKQFWVDGCSQIKSRPAEKAFKC